MISSGPLQEKIRRFSELKGYYPAGIFETLSGVARSCDCSVYLVGGTVRDLLLDNKHPGDIDLTVDGGAHRFCRELIRQLGGGAFVELGTEFDEAARVVWQGLDVDVSSFRGQAQTIEEDLLLRDFTINGIGAPLEMVLSADHESSLIDPQFGIEDIQAGVIRHCQGAFEDDPLRLIRAYRFMVRLGFTIAEATLFEIRRCLSGITRVAPERIGYELELIIIEPGGADAIRQMHQAGLLHFLIPELYAGDGVEQPGFHHLDVFNHNLETLKKIEVLLTQEDLGYGTHGCRFRQYVTDSGALRDLKWAALLHDVGKPVAKDESGEGDRVTFYGHDEVGRDMVEVIGSRLRWSRDQRQQVGHLVSMHMHPFHLCTTRKQHDLTRRAALNLCKRAGGQLEGLFLLAMADSLASKGELKPEKMEKDLVDLYSEVVSIYDKHIQPVLSCHPLITGKDLIDVFELVPGPVFSVILKELQALQVDGVVHNREDALEWVGKYLQEKKVKKSVQ